MKEAGHKFTAIICVSSILHHEIKTSIIMSELDNDSLLWVIRWYIWARNDYANKSTLTSLR